MCSYEKDHISKKNKPNLSGKIQANLFLVLFHYVRKIVLQVQKQHFYFYGEKSVRNNKKQLKAFRNRVGY